VRRLRYSSLRYRDGLARRGADCLRFFPLLGIVLSVSSHRAHGSEFVVSLLRGMVLGRFSFAAFCLFLSLALNHQDPTTTFAEAAVLAMFVQWCTKRMGKPGSHGSTAVPE